jgi:uncharacterized membrane protein
MADDAYDDLWAEQDRAARARRERRDERRARRVGSHGETPERGGGGAAELRHLAATPAGRLLIGAVAAIAIATVVGLLALWPYGWHPHGTRGVPPTVAAKVDAVHDARCSSPVPQQCRTLDITAGRQTTRLSLGPVASAPAVAAGETIRVTRTPLAAGEPRPPHFEPYTFVDVQRHDGLLWMGIAAAALAAAVLRRRGVLAVLGVGLSVALMVWFLVPAILAGRPALLVALVAALAVMFVTVGLTNGIGAQSLAAVLGITATLVLACAMAALGADLAHLDGKTDEITLALGAQNAQVSLRGIVLAAMLVGALGVLADTAVTQASAVMALRRADPRLSARRLYREASVVGRDHLSATIHTLVLAYAGAALPLLLVMRQAQLPAGDALDAQAIAEPIVATLVGCVALIAAVPLTTGLAAGLIARVPAGALPAGGHGHAH